MNFFLLIALVIARCSRAGFTATFNPIEGSRAVDAYSNWYTAAFNTFNDPCYFRVVPNWAKVEKKKFLTALQTVNKQLGPVVKNRPTFELALKNVLGLVNLWKRGVENCSLPSAIPEGLKSPIFYASYYAAVWKIYNSKCLVGIYAAHAPGSFWKSITKNQLKLANSKAIASLGRVVGRTDYELALKKFL